MKSNDWWIFLRCIVAPFAGLVLLFVLLLVLGAAIEGAVIAGKAWIVKWVWVHL